MQTSCGLALNKTHISIASFLLYIDKQNSPRFDAAKHGVPSGAILFAYMIFIEKWKQNEELLPMPLKMKRDSSKWEGWRNPSVTSGLSFQLI